jgi:hypothetical protein
MPTAEHPVVVAPRRPRAVPTWGYFRSAAAVDALLPELSRLGVPRDLIEVVVTPRGAASQYGGRALAPRPVWKFVSLGGLLGLLAGAFGGLFLIARPGFDDAAHLAYALLFTPMITTTAGAVVGLAAALLASPKPSAWRSRIVPPGDDELLVVVRARGEDQVALVLDALRTAGGRDAQVLP